MIRRLRSTVLSGSYAALLVTMLAVLVIASFTPEETWLRGLLGAAIIGVTASALLAAWRRHRSFLIAIALGVLSLLAGLAQYGGLENAGAIEDGLRFVFLAVVTYLILMDVARSKRVTMDTILGAACVYMLMGLTWANVFSLLQWADPGAFDFGSHAPSVASELRAGLLTYYSYITLTTVGYGDITPVSPPARVLSAVEGLIAQLYLAIIVARLVSLQITSSLRNDSE
jgi:hypothetical protein